MAWRDRPYAYDNSTYDRGMGGGRIGGIFPRPRNAVLWLLILNGVVFVTQTVVSGGAVGPLEQWFGATVGGWWQVWRYVTFQFLHANGWHIVMNMIALWLLGTALEDRFGSRRFVAFYLTCGAVAGVAYVVIMSLWAPPGLRQSPLIGASGGVYGIILAAAILLPHFRLILLFFPVPIRIAAALIFGVMILQLLGSARVAIGGDHYAMWAAMSDVAHFGGAAAAAVWLYAGTRIGRAWRMHAARDKRKGSWEKRMEQRRQRQLQIDAILEKIHQRGLGSLSWREKRLLKQATHEQRQEEQRLRHL